MMPTFDPFKALCPNEHGLPFCVPKVDVSGFDRWVTLSGHKKGDGAASQASIDSSASLARKLFWRLSSMSVTTSADYNGDFGGDPQSESITSVTRDQLPFDLICESSWGKFKSKDSSGFVLIIVSALIRANIAMMYDGGTIPENFVGFGQRLQLSTASQSVGDAEVSVVIYSYGNDEGSGSGKEVDHDYVSVSGLNFICRARYEGVSGTPTLNAETLSASSTSSFLDLEAKINSFDFYENP